MSHRSRNRYNVLPSSTDTGPTYQQQSALMYALRSNRGKAVAAILLITMVVIILCTGTIPSYFSSKSASLSTSQQSSPSDTAALTQLDEQHISPPIEREKQPDKDPTFITDRVFFDVVIGDETEADAKAQRIVFGLFGNVAPRTVANFKALCQCDHGVSPLSNKPLCYKGSTFHRIIPKFMVQGKCTYPTLHPHWLCASLVYSTRHKRTLAFVHWGSIHCCFSYADKSLYTL